MAETAVGASSGLSWMKEATWGTVPATPAMTVLPLTTESIAGAFGVVENDEIRADRRYEQPGQGSSSPGGDINVVWSADALGYFIYRGIGGTLTPVGSDPVVHTIEESASPDLPSMTIEKRFTDIDQYLVYAGSRISTMTFGVAPDSNVTGTISIQAQSESAMTGTSLDATPTSIAHLPLNSFVGTLTEGAVGGSGGSAFATVTDFNLTLENNLEGVNTILNANAQQFGALLAGRLRISGTFSAFFVDATLFNKYQGFTESGLIIRMADSNTPTEYIEFSIHSIRYAGSTPGISGEGPLTIDLEFTAYTEAAGGKQLVAVVANQQADLNF